jgi:hypothetical protein
VSGLFSSIFSITGWGKSSSCWRESRHLEGISPPADKSVCSKLVCRRASSAVDNTLYINGKIIITEICSHQVEKNLYAKNN